MTTFNDDRFTIAQQAIHTPEVQAIIKQLSAFNLGVFMPHMHDDAGGMLSLPETLVQVENDMVVSFVPPELIADTPEQKFVPVGWRWSEGANAVSTATHCPIRQVNGEYKHMGSRPVN